MGHPACSMRILYVDESGDQTQLGEEKDQPPEGASPALVVAGVIIDVASVYAITRGFLDLKSLHHVHVRHHSPEFLDRIHAEVKGSALRKRFREGGTADARKVAEDSLSGLLALLQEHGCQIVAKVAIKPRAPFYGQAEYGAALQHLCHAFQAHLEERDEFGSVIMDTRNDGKNLETAHDIFTRKFALGGDRFPRIGEVPAFASSKTHAGLQIADWLASALIAPMAVRTFYEEATWKGSGFDPGHDSIRDRFVKDVTALQFWHFDAGEWQGGIRIADHRNNKPSDDLFPPP